jgi:ATP-grasp domain-containing protein
VLRRFERFTSAEVRTWWVGGECVLSGPHPDTPHDVAPDPDLGLVAPLVADLGLPFVTVDLVERSDGAWRVVELGDGQVSDRPGTVSPAALVEALLGHGVQCGSRPV